MLTLSQGKNLLLTGPPGCGKTTAVRRLVERLADLRLAGFLTHELREGGNRVGFEAIALSTRQHALLAHAEFTSRPGSSSVLFIYRRVKP